MLVKRVNASVDLAYILVDGERRFEMRREKSGIWSLRAFELDGRVGPILLQDWYSNDLLLVVRRSFGG